MPMTEVCAAQACWSGWWPLQEAGEDWHSLFTPIAGEPVGLNTIPLWKPNDLAISAKY